MKHSNTMTFFISLFITIFAFSSISFASYSSNYTEPTVLVKKGSTGISVKWVQDMLNHNGYNISVDGIFGTQTQNAVISFQKTYGLEADGIVGKYTRNALKAYAKEKNTTSLARTINGCLYTTDNVYIRNGPGTNYYAKDLLSKNTKVYVYQIRSDGWSYSKINGIYGYIYSEYLSSSIQNNNTSSLPAFIRNNNDLLSIIKACKTYVANNNFVYDLSDGTRTIPLDQSKLYNRSLRRRLQLVCYLGTL